MDSNLWRMENYLDFLAARRELLAQAANEFLSSLLTGDIPETETVSESDDVITAVPGGIVDEAEEELILKTNIWITEQGLPEGDFLYELVDEDSGELIAVLDLAWPTGIQTGYSDPVALLIDEELETLELASSAGFRCFTDIDSFRHYVHEEIMALEPA